MDVTLIAGDKQIYSKTLVYLEKSMKAKYH